MPTTKKLGALKINKLTEAQLATATINEDELYLVTDAENPVTIKTDSTLSGDGSVANPLSVSPEVVATSVKTTSDSGLSFLDKNGSQMWNMSGRILFSGFVGEGQTIGQIGTTGSTLDAVYAAKLCKGSTELSVRDGTSGDIAVTSELPEAKTGAAGQVYTKTETGAEWKTVSGGGSSTDNNGLEGDYCSKYGIVDETASGLPTQGTGNQIIIPAQLVMNVPGVSGLTTNASAITHDLVSTTNCEIFLSEGTVIEATDVFFQTDEPEYGATGYAAWWNGTEWKFKSNDTGNVWRAANAVRIAKCIFTDGALTSLCFTGCRVLDKQEWLPKNGITTTDTEFSYVIKTKNGDFTCKCNSYFGSYWAWGIGANFLQYGFGSVGTIGGNSTTGAKLYKTGGIYEFYVGTQWDPLAGLYTKTINGGAADAVITVPTVSGTMVVATPPTTAGNYVLKATVTEGGTVTTQWVAEA